MSVRSLFWGILPIFLLWVLSIYPFIKHYTIVVSIITIQFSQVYKSYGEMLIAKLHPRHNVSNVTGLVYFIGCRVFSNCGYSANEGIGLNIV